MKLSAASSSWLLKMGWMLGSCTVLSALMRARRASAASLIYSFQVCGQMTKRFLLGCAACTVSSAAMRAAPF